MEINITAGECLNEILERRFPEKQFVPFNEAMTQGTYSSLLFSADFIRERSVCHGVPEGEYREKMSGFMTLLEHLQEYDEIVLWFGDEPFCVENRKVVLEALKGRGYSGGILLNIVVEETGEILQQRRL